MSQAKVMVGGIGYSPGWLSLCKIRFFNAEYVEISLFELVIIYIIIIIFIIITYEYLSRIASSDLM